MLFSKTTQLLIAVTISCLLHTTSVRAQGSAVPITGTVTNEKGQPIEAASVSISGSGKGTVTDKNGFFSLTAPIRTVLIITYVGYDTVVRQAAQNSLQIVLHPAGSSLNDVIVIGYGTQKRKEVTGAIATVSAKDFQQGSITTPEQLIAGKVAGVSITSNGGSPGAGSTIRIRGGASLNASNDPLIVIDGLPLSGNNIYGLSNTLSMVNPNEIESFTILKDAASTAIYGSRASNGVILISTKRGGNGRAKFNFSTQISVSKLIKEEPVLSAGQFRQYVDSLGGGSYDNVHTYKSLLGASNTDWQKEIYQTAISTDNNLSVTGSLKDLPYRFSVGFLSQQGILRTDNLQRVTAGLALSPGLFDNHLKIDISLKGAVANPRFANNAAISSAVYFDPTQPVHAKSPYGNYFEWASVDAGSGAITLNKLAPRNPVALLDLYNNSATVYRSFGNVRFDYKLHFLPDLHANLNLGYDIAKGSGTTKVPAYAAQNYLDSGQNNKYRNKIGNTVLEFYLNYDKTIPSLRSHITLLAGYGYYNNLSTNYNYPNIRANGDTIPGSKPAFPLDKPENTLISYYGRLVYTYNDRYILAGSLRRDGSSRFGPDVRWGLFPSAAFTWRINQENFLKSVSAISDMKLRLSYGITGNQDGIYNYPYLAVYSLGDNTSRVQFGNEYYNMASPAAYDAGIKWEQTSTYNAGLDLGFLDNRLQATFDVYYKKTHDLLNTIPIPAGSNFSSTLLTNVGNIENKGVEFQFAATPVKTKDFTWDLGFNVARNSNKITNLTATKDSSYPGTLTGNGVVQINSVGYNANAFYVYHQVYDKTGRPVEGVYQDINGDGVINQQDLYRYKSPFPKWIFGFSTSFTYQRWTLSTVLRANLGNYTYNSIAVGGIRSNVLNPLGYLAGSITSVLNSRFYYGQPQSDYYVENASFLKMDNLGLSYNVGDLIHKTVKLRINANVQNVFTVTKYTGLDPEIYGGIDNTLYPRPRTFVLGANLQF
jgi:TonB-linked SusC/RagA family outer membrane protein